MKIIKYLLFGVIGLLVLAVCFVGLSIPLSKWFESDMESLSIDKSKVVFSNANIVPMDSLFLLENYSLFVEKGKIKKLMPDSVADYSGYEVINLKGKFIVPGLIDMHAHIFDRSDLTQYLSYGVTTVRNMMGFPMHLRWKEQLSNGDLIGSRLITSTPTLNSGSNAGPFHKKIEGVQEIEALITQYKDKGYDFIKVYNGLSKEQFEEIISVAEKLNMDISGHPVSILAREEFVYSNVSSFEHVEEIYNTYLKRRPTDSLTAEIISDFSQAKMPVTATLSAYHHIYRVTQEGEAFFKEFEDEPISPMLRFIGTRQLSGYLGVSENLKNRIAFKNEYHKRLVSELQASNVPLLLGTDTGPNLTTPGSTLHKEIELLKEAGLTNYDILYSGTVEAAKVLGIFNEVGSIEVGKYAEFLVTELNPFLDLKTLSTPNSIMLKEKLFDQAAVKMLQVSGSRKTSWYFTLGNFLDHLIKK